MNPGHRLVVSSKTTFSNDMLRKDIIVMNIFSRETFSKANSGDEDKDTQLCCTIPGSKMSKDCQADRYTGPMP